MHPLQNQKKTRTRKQIVGYTNLMTQVVQTTNSSAFLFACRLWAL